MVNFDGVISKARSFASAAGTKAQEVAELAKIKLQASQMRSDIDANYLKLGEIIYDLNKNNNQNDELVNMCIAEIESQLAELDELNVKLDNMKKVVRCTECMAENSSGALYCARCGAALKGVADAAEEVASEVVDTAKEVASEFSDVAKMAADAAVDTAKSAMDTMSDAAKKFSSAIDDEN